MITKKKQVGGGYKLLIKHRIKFIFNGVRLTLGGAAAIGQQVQSYVGVRYTVAVAC